MQLNTRYTEKFEDRHIGPRPFDLPEMLKTVGVDSLETLISKTVPAGIRLPRPLNIGEPMSEPAFLEMLKAKAAKNKIYKKHNHGRYNRKKRDSWRSVFS